MIQHVYERVSECGRLNGVAVATDDDRIVKAVKGFGGTAILTGAHHQSGTDRLAEAAGLLGLAGDDVVVNVQGDEPLLEPSMLEVLVAAILAPPHCEMATLAYPSSSEEEYLDPNVVKVVVDGDGNALYFSRAPVPFRRGEPTGAFLKHLGFYAYRREFLERFTSMPPGKLEKIEKLEQLRALENGIRIRVAISPVDSIGVDTPGDLKTATAAIAAKEREAP